MSSSKKSASRKRSSRPSLSPVKLTFVDGSAEMGLIDDSRRSAVWVQWLLHLDLRQWITRLVELDLGGPSWFLGPMVLMWTPHIVSLFDQLFHDFRLPEWIGQEEVLATLELFKLVAGDIATVEQVQSELRAIISETSKLATASSLHNDSSWGDVLQAPQHTIQLLSISEVVAWMVARASDAHHNATTRSSLFETKKLLRGECPFDGGSPAVKVAWLPPRPDPGPSKRFRQRRSLSHAADEGRGAAAAAASLSPGEANVISAIWFEHVSSELGGCQDVSGTTHD